MVSVVGRGESGSRSILATLVDLVDQLLLEGVSCSVVVVTTWAMLFV